MKMPTEKQLQRIEKKRKKMAALLAITKLNDKDREPKVFVLGNAEGSSVGRSQGERLGSSSDGGCSCGSVGSESPRRKRTCTAALSDQLPESINSPNTTIEGSDGSDSLANKKPRLIGEDYAKLKQELKERKAKLKSIPRFRLKAVGENASLNVSMKGEERIPIFLSDVQHLLLYSLLGHHSPYSPGRWCLLEKYNKVTHTVVLVIEGLSLYHFVGYESLLDHITSNMTHRLELITPAIYGGSLVEELAAVPLTGTQSHRLIEQFGSLEAALRSTCDLVKLLRTVFPMQPFRASEGTKNDNTTRSDLPVTDKFPRTQLLLSPWQLLEENYPLPLKGELAKKYCDYVPTKDVYDEATPRSPMFGLDCEMCMTTSRSLELTRISLVDEKMNIVYDELVMPDNKITDYLTRYSGITKERLSGVTTTLSDVQQALRELLPPDAILVGQSLNCDLHTLKMIHPYVIDTSVIYNITGDRYRKTKLQTLAREFLNERIQHGGQGHCSTEDSMASLKLVQLKLANSVDYGDAVLAGHSNIQALKKSADRPTSHSPNKLEFRNYATTIFKHVAKDAKTAAIVGEKESMNEYAKYLSNSSLNITNDEHFEKEDQVRLVVANDNNHAVSRTSEILMEHAFTLCHVRITKAELRNKNIEKTLRTVNEWVGTLWQHMAVHGLSCVVFGGQSNAANGACFLDVKRDVTILKS